MNVILSRTYGVKQTTSSLYIFDGDRSIFNCKAIELPQLGNQHNISCIPEGKYEVHKIISPTKGKCFQVMNVPNRTAILIHIGNYASGVKIDTQGCILVGLRFIDLNQDGNIDVADSTKALSTLLSLLPDTFNLYII